MSATTAPVVVSPTDRRITRVLRLAANDLSKRPTLAQAAGAAGLEPAYFSRRFRQVMGVTFTEWSARLRVDEAKRLLRFIDLSITAVAASVGYADVTTFERVFRRCEGICPRQYRRMFFETSEMGTRTTNAECETRIAESKTTDAETRRRENG